MGLIDKLFTTNPEVAETEAAKPLINAKAEREKEEGKAVAKERAANANATIFNSCTDNFIKVVEAYGGGNFQTFEDYLSGLELFAETQAKVAKTISS